MRNNLSNTTNRRRKATLAALATSTALSAVGPHPRPSDYVAAPEPAEAELAPDPARSHSALVTSVEPAYEGVIVVAGERYLPPEVLAAMIGVSTRTLQRWHVARTGPPRITLGRRNLYPEKRLPDWLASREVGPLDRRRRPSRAA
jgi:hypothetical protein